MRAALLELIVDPVEGLPLERSGSEALVARSGARYPVVDGISVLLLGDVAPTQGVAKRSYDLSRAPRTDPLFIDTLGEITSQPQAKMAIRARLGAPLDPVINYLIGPACGRAYRRNDWTSPPIPLLPLTGTGRLLDIGCNWGRWTIAAAKRGFTPVGLDPSLGALLAAKRLATRMRLAADFVCGDARHLPFRTAAFDVVFSYSVLQHFSDANLIAALGEVRRVLGPPGRSVIQMASSLGIGALLSQAKRGFREPRGFEVRYRTRAELRHAFAEHIGPTEITADCFIGLGLQAGDAAAMTPAGRFVTRLSEAAKRIQFVDRFADSVYCRSRLAHELPAT